jgi:cell division septum initiation protein DivIVA
MIRLRSAGVLAILLAIMVSFASALPGKAQNRLSDKDLEQRIKNMNSDIKKFRSMFNSSVSKTSIRKTSQAKDAKALVQNVQNASNSLYEKFKSTKKPDPYLQNCLDLSSQMDNVFQSTQFDADTVAQRQKIKRQLKDIAAAFNMPGY